MLDSAPPPAPRKRSRDEILYDLDRIVVELKLAEAPRWQIIDCVMNALNRPLM